MRRNTGWSMTLAALLGLLTLGSECEDEYDCSDICRKLADCESGWLEDEGAAPMTEQERADFAADCLADCEEGHEAKDCIHTASCDELRDGKCTDDWVF
jgi:hypothetical protein